MRIDVCGCTEIRVSQPVLDLFQRDAVGQQQACTAVTKLVEATMGIPPWKRKMIYGMILSEATVYAVAFFVERGFSWHENAENINTQKWLGLLPPKQ